MIEIRGELYATATDAAAQLATTGVTAARIRDWQRRGLLHPIRVCGRNWYRMRDVWTVERDTRHHGRRRSLTTHAA